VALARTRFDLLLELPDEAAVRALAPDFRALAAIDARGVIVTARGADADFVSRFFGPAAGVDEDPVTGSAHCALAPWWAARLGTDHLVGWQASARGGRVRCALRGDRVRLAGETVLAWRGTLELPPPGGP
jgi:predicted PhzF superfamily epimerase YddE/YHI9